MSEEIRFEKESAKVAELVKNDTMPEAAEALSQALLPMNHKDYGKFLDSVRAMSEKAADPANQLIIENNVYLRSNSPEVESQYVVVMPGQTLSGICKNEGWVGKNNSGCVNAFVEFNSLKNPDKVMAGQALVQPAYDGW